MSVISYMPPQPGMRNNGHLQTKNLSSARDERLFRCTTLILHQSIQLSRIGNGGPEGARTPDLIHAIDALSQLRYRPKCCTGTFPGMSSLIDVTHYTQ